MSIRTTAFVENEFYHIYNRGNSKQIIFKDWYDYTHFQTLLYICNSNKSFITRNHGNKSLYDIKVEHNLVAIGAYCLMPNHFHILLTPLVEGGVSLFMQKVGTAYSMYFNKKYQRTGGLFEGKFKSQYAGEDKYLKYLFSYIHLNPVKMIDPSWKEFGLRDKKAALEYLNKYEYSSYMDFVGIDRKENKILDTWLFPEYFPSVKTFEAEILGWFSTRQDLVE